MLSKTIVNEEHIVSIKRGHIRSQQCLKNVGQKGIKVQEQSSNAITYKHMSGNKNLPKLCNSCLSGHLAQICKTHGRNAVLHLLHVRKDRDLKPRFLFSCFPFSQLCLICSRGLFAIAQSHLAASVLTACRDAGYSHTGCPENLDRT